MGMASRRTGGWPIGRGNMGTLEELLNAYDACSLGDDAAVAERLAARAALLSSIREADGFERSLRMSQQIVASLRDENERLRSTLAERELRQVVKDRLESVRNGSAVLVTGEEAEARLLAPRKARDDTNGNGTR